MKDINIVKEKGLENYPKPISLKSTQKIIEQMRNIKNNICKIKLLNGTKGIGFFCKIAFNNNHLSVLITNNHVINEEILEKEKNIIISTNKEEIEIDLDNRIKYTNKKYDITIIEIKENKDKVENYLELDENIINNTSKSQYIKENIYIIQYKGGKEEASVSYGIIKDIDEIDKYKFEYLCNIDKGLSNPLILSIKTNKVIGIHNEAYNNRGTFLNFPIQEYIYKNIDILAQINKKFNLHIENTNINELNLYFKEIGNEDLKILPELNLKELKALNLYYNKISDIKILEKVKFEKLKILNLGYNKISDISILEKTNFRELQELNLSDNKISDIKVLERVKFENLEILDLEKNKISDIHVFAKVNFKELKILNLSNNNISEIKVLEKVNFDQLEVLDLGNNKKSNIGKLKKVGFKNLKALYLQSNNISEIKVFEKVKFEKLEILNLSDNIIYKENYDSIIKSLELNIAEFNI